MRFSVVAGVILALSVVGAVLVGMGERSAKREFLAQELAELRANGLLPASGHGLSRDGGAYYEQLDALQATLPVKTGGRFDLAFELVDLEAAAAFFEPHEATLDRLEELVLGPDGQLAALDRRGHNAKMPRLMRARATANALCTRAVVAASEGRGADALRSLTAALDFSYALDHASLINLMIEVAVDTLIAKTWQRIDRDFGHHLGASDFAVALGPRFERACNHERIAVSMRGELVDLLGYVENEGVLTDLDTTVSDLGVHIIEHYRETMENWEDDCTRAPAPKTEACDRSCAFDRVQDSIHYSLRGYQLTRLALAIGAQRARKGDWPATLEELELTGAPALDPCLGTPFDYEVGATEVRLWSEPPPRGVTVCGRSPGNVNPLLDWRWPR